MSVKLKKVCKSFGELQVLEDISLEIVPGEIVSIIGASGCGKSTLLRVIAGLEDSDSGSVLIDPELEHSRSFVFQDPLLLDWRKLEANISLPLEITAPQEKSKETLLQEVLALTNLCEHRQKYPHELSGGMRMRASLARALITQPKLIFLDEPFGALDEMTREKLNLEIQQIHQQKPSTIILVTHNLSEAVFMSHRIFVMGLNSGRIEAEITVDQNFPREASFFNENLFQEKLCEVRQVLREAER
ncbi:ABC transporter ATP-binding protein [Lentisphaera profundi]|uniref:ABC transporter ATP-binding protein n=1 Tax=Lentisphaera profundi TaxID=1658616 RepID=A0ABY7VY54_9BACT|nr:ABC transporter ATP-binding protein [Lentisphaera profundi]WDE98647.1 ABC transporter ATP-binding protein [Lentisphaera profundi]